MTTGRPKSRFLAIRVSSPTPHPCNVCSAHSSHTRSCFKDTALKEECAVEIIWTRHLAEPH